jgi:predicted 2-oxoglutarate/Fe(II)-dependent dioxygenase YbiX
MSKWLGNEFDVEKVAATELEGGLAGFGLILENVLSRRECQHIIAATERIGYGTLGKGNTGAAYRGNRRLQLDDANGVLGRTLFTRIKPYIPLSYLVPGEEGTYVFESINTRYRFAKYCDGEGFMVHVDKPTVYEKERMSILTVNIYLNDLPPEQGGRTRFYRKINGKPVASAGGCAGSLVLFQQSNMNNTPWHDGQQVRGGIKYLMRTDVIYRLKKEEAAAA